MPLGNVHLTPQLVQAVRDAVDIVDVASDHTRLQKAGHRYRGLCPLHKEKTPSFSVDPTQGLYYCFGCGRGGDAIGLHMELTGDDFPEAIETLARRYGVPLPSRPARSEGRGSQRPEITPVLEAAAAYFVGELRRQRAPREYLERRRIDLDLVERFGLGYAPDGWQNLLDALRFEHPVAALEAAGLVARSDKSGRHYDRFRHRLIFPIKNASGRIVGFGGRTLGDDKAKYVNTSETDEFHKGNLLYGLDCAKRAIREAGRVLLVEGYFDVLGAAAAGIDWVVASMGTSLTPAQAKLLSRYAEEVVVGYDGDAAGETAHRRALSVLLGEGLAVRRARFGEGEDPDSLRLAQGPEAVAAAVEAAGDSVEEELDRLVPPEVRRDPRSQAAAAREVVALLAPVPDAILRYAYARRAADRLGVPAEILGRRLETGGAGEGGNPRAREGVSPSAAEGGRSALGPADGAMVHKLEDEVLSRLLEPEGQFPPLDRMPPEGVFFDPVARNIYRVIYALYRRDGGPPSARAVVDAVGDEPEVLTRIARYQNEVEYPAGCRRLGLFECLERLSHRWRKERLRDLVREIQEAQRKGDRARLDELLDEKQRVSHILHRGLPETYPSSARTDEP